MERDQTSSVPPEADTSVLVFLQLLRSCGQRPGVTTASSSLTKCTGFLNIDFPTIPYQKTSLPYDMNFHQVQQVSDQEMVLQQGCWPEEGEGRRSGEEGDWDEKPGEGDGAESDAEQGQVNGGPDCAVRGQEVMWEEGGKGQMPMMEVNRCELWWTYLCKELQHIMYLYSSSTWLPYYPMTSFNVWWELALKLRYTIYVWSIVLYNVTQNLPSSAEVSINKIIICQIGI